MSLKCEKMSDSIFVQPTLTTASKLGSKTPFSKNFLQLKRSAKAIQTDQSVLTLGSISAAGNMSF